MSHKRKYIYMLVTQDEYELPLDFAETARELAVRGERGTSEQMEESKDMSLIFIGALIAADLIALTGCVAWRARR